MGIIFNCFFVVFLTENTVDNKESIVFRSIFLDHTV